MHVSASLKKKRILLASILKPVDDTRMFEKMGQTLAEDADVHIMGYASQSAVSYPGITFHSVKPFGRLSGGRILMRFKILRIVFLCRPDILIITTHELLPVGLFFKIFLSGKLIYDVQENYARNILYTNAFPKLLRPFVAAGVRMKEWILSPLVHHFLLAERGYEKELRFPGNRKTIIENKTKKEAIVAKKKNDGHIRLLFTGTLAESTGIFTAIDLAQQLHTLDSSIRLTIIGYSSLPAIVEKIKNTIRDKSFIELIGGDHLVSHSQIVQQIQSADFGILAYKENPSTINSIPTKLYEYLGYQLPIIMVGRQPGMELAKPYAAAMVISMEDLKSETVLNQMKNQNFYTSIPQNVFWESEAGKLKKAVLGD